MDTLFKIRLAIWLLVLALWGSLVYQFLYEETPETAPRMQWVSNPFPRKPPNPPAPLDNLAAQPEPAARGGLPTAEPASSRQPPPEFAAGRPSQSSPAPGRPPESAVATAMPTTPLPAPWDSSGRLASAAPPGHFIIPLQPKLPSRTTAPRTRYSDPSLRRHEYAPVQEPATPTGFVKTETAHFYVFSEGEAASDNFLESVEHLHSNLMLDLAAFSPWARDQKVSIFLFNSQESYRRVTGRPAWSGGASSVSKRKIYLYESDELLGILAHEMCHIYFDSFFLAGRTDPLWLSEGMATLEQIERGLSSPNWLPENLDILYRGGGFKFEDLMRIDNTAGANDDNVRLWYTQSYSIVRFLLRAQWRSSFYHFCGFLRDGLPMQEALYRAYGMPYNRVKAIEYAWRYDLETRRITNIQPASR